jgi:hypothetical protein
MVFPKLSLLHDSYSNYKIINLGPYSKKHPNLDIKKPLYMYSVSDLSSPLSSVDLINEGLDNDMCIQTPERSPNMPL